MRKFIRDGLAPVEEMLNRVSSDNFCYGPTPTIADICLVPQMYNADRWGVETSDLPRVRAITAACEALPAFRAAYPQNSGETA